MVETAYNINTTIPTVPLLNVYDTVRDQIVPASAVNYTGYVYVVGTNFNDLANINNIETNNNRYNTQTAFVPVTPIPDQTMDSRGCVRFNNNGTLEFQQYLEFNSPGNWKLGTATDLTIAFWLKLLSTEQWILLNRDVSNQLKTGNEGQTVY